MELACILIITVGVYIIHARFISLTFNCFFFPFNLSHRFWDSHQ